MYLCVFGENIRRSVMNLCALLIDRYVLKTCRENKHEEISFSFFKVVCAYSDKNNFETNVRKERGDFYFVVRLFVLQLNTVHEFEYRNFQSYFRGPKRIIKYGPSTIIIYAIVRRG